nr:MAG TPA: hypothetical protein [Caudoviricetes sp.]
MTSERSTAFEPYCKAVHPCSSRYQARRAQRILA